MAVSFDLFGTLLAVERPSDPAAAIAAELANRGVTVPEDWPVAYCEHHLDAPEAREIPLPKHVSAALGSRGIDPDPGAVVEMARERGVAIRDATTFRPLDSHVRVAVRTPEENDRLFEALDV